LLTGPGEAVRGQPRRDRRRHHPQHRPGRGRRADGALIRCRRAAAAEQAARLLGAAHAVRGAFDESSLDAPPARAQATETLGQESFAAVYESALTNSYESALALAREVLAAA